jgi:hypothetical protein
MQQNQAMAQEQATLMSAQQVRSLISKYRARQTGQKTESGATVYMGKGIQFAVAADPQGSANYLVVIGACAC